MITATYKLNWKGEPYKRRLLRELQRATREGAERVRRNAKQDQLNTTGKAATTKAGLNRGNVAKRIGRRAMIVDLKQVRSVRLPKRKSLLFGGSYNGIDRIYWYGEPLHRWVQSSQPGTPPHKQTGTLQRSIAVEVASHGLRAKIGPGQQLKYGRIQELGGKGLINLPPRPYMRPALLAEAQRIMFGFEMAIARASK